MKNVHKKQEDTEITENTEEKMGGGLSAGFVPVAELRCGAELGGGEAILVFALTASSGVGIMRSGIKTAIDLCKYEQLF